MDKATPAPFPASVEIQPYDAWCQYAKRAGLLNDEGVAPDRFAAQTAFSAYSRGWNDRAEVERLAAQAAPTERDAQDAARYRWLRDGELTADYPYPVMRMGGSRVDDQTIWNDELDAAIDAAMAKD